MRKLLTWVIIAVVLLGGLILIANWQGERSERRAAQETRERQQRIQEEQTRQALLAAPPPASGTGATVPNAPRADPQREYQFRQLAEQNQVEVLEYRAISAREVVVRLRTRNQTGIGDLMDSAVRQGIMLNFDDRMQRQNDRMSVDPMSGARIFETRFSFQVG